MKKLSEIIKKWQIDLLFIAAIIGIVALAIIFVGGIVWLFVKHCFN